MWISEQTAIISLYNINWLFFFITETVCVYCAVRTGYLYIIQFNFPLYWTNEPPCIFQTICERPKRTLSAIFTLFPDWPSLQYRTNTNARQRHDNFNMWRSNCKGRPWWTYWVWGLQHCDCARCWPASGRLSYGSRSLGVRDILKGCQTDGHFSPALCRRSAVAVCVSLVISNSVRCNSGTVSVTLRYVTVRSVRWAASKQDRRKGRWKRKEGNKNNTEMTRIINSTA